MTIGDARVQLGDLGGLADFERGIELAEEQSSPEAVAGIINLADTVMELGDLARAIELRESARASAERLGDGAQPEVAPRGAERKLYWTGRWDEALALADAFVAESEGEAVITSTRTAGSCAGGSGSPGATVRGRWTTPRAPSSWAARLAIRRRSTPRWRSALARWTTVGTPGDASAFARRASRARSAAGSPSARVPLDRRSGTGPGCARPRRRACSGAATARTYTLEHGRASHCPGRRADRGRGSRRDRRAARGGARPHVRRELARRSRTSGRGRGPARAGACVLPVGGSGRCDCRGRAAARGSPVDTLTVVGSGGRLHPRRQG